MDMPPIKACSATGCAYNQEDQCQALAITVGHGDKARCDTYWSGEQDAGDPQSNAGVGACRAEDCRHNERLVCTAADVAIGRRGDTVDCLTFETQ